MQAATAAGFALRNTLTIARNSGARNCLIATHRSSHDAAVRIPMSSYDAGFECSVASACRMARLARVLQAFACLK